MKIALTTLGCKLNYAETSTYERGFRAAGWEVVPWSAQADVYLLNTCAVTETAEKKSRNLIRRAHKVAPDARIAVTGCYAQLRPKDLLAIPGVWKVFSSDEKTQIVPFIAEGAYSPESSLRDPSPIFFPAYSVDLSGASRRPAVPGILPTGKIVEGEKAAGVIRGQSPRKPKERTRSFLKVQDGCDNFCAYCTVPYARGRSRNIPICEAVRQAKEIAAKGVKEIVLTGVNTGDFGRTSGETFLNLLKALNEVEGIERYRISSIEPNLITPEIVDWIASGTKFQPHFHIPLQSGSDTLLRRVSRRYDTALFASRIDYIRKAFEGPGRPLVFFGIDVIVGLPGESEELFEETYTFLKERIRPAFLHVFPYSKRPGTRAAQWPDQVPEHVKAERVARLEALSNELHTAFVEANKGVRTTVLWESADKNGLMGGYTANYIRLEAPFDAARVNTIEEVTL
ncbi:MAG: tRNA (N(6)-L-threonylcarbamoyladenosine(37)-C(2))-methylthiotransferase MtaB [Bacteroidales bacterium]|nr:tRNA (N(6)-L-threonylcarbamoyladenosine(37)-C(2))-methylthiotransferase MtaB [Bacteroidales bacterium]